MANYYHRRQLQSHFKTSIKRNVAEKEKEESLQNKIVFGKTTIQELLSLILQEIEADSTYYKNVEEICRNLNRIMRFFYHDLNVVIEPFGSSVTKLALKGSDVDIFINFGESLPEPSDVLVKTLKNKVRKFGYFVSAIPIFARVPIVHCVHRNKVSCDLSFVNALGVYNSHLVKFLLSLNERVRPLILILKYLIKQEGLLGSNAITSFALIMLIVYFLQIIENPFFPSINTLQKLATKKEIVGEWDVSFTTQRSHLPVITNQLSVTELLQKFFEFYSTFEFGFYIISVFTAKSFLKSIFFYPKLIPDDFQLYKTKIEENEDLKFDSNKFMCVQSPFDHNVNITRNATQKSVVQFQKFCSACASIGQELLLENCEGDNHVRYLIQLMEHKTEEPNRKKAKIESVVIYVGDTLTYDESDCFEESIRETWLKNVLDSVKELLCEVLKCDIQLETTSSENATNVIKCQFHYWGLITKLRSQAKNGLNFPQDISTVEKEKIISNYLCDTVLKNSTKACLKFEVTCNANKNPTSFCMNLKTGETQKSRNHTVKLVFHFIQNNFPKWLK